MFHEGRCIAPSTMPSASDLSHFSAAAGFVVSIPVCEAATRQRQRSRTSPWTMVSWILEDSPVTTIRCSTNTHPRPWQSPTSRHSDSGMARRFSGCRLDGVSNDGKRIEILRHRRYSGRRLQSDAIGQYRIGHGAIDAGGGYTYFNPATGNEFSSVAGLTYNFKNPNTEYQSGIDFHFDWGASHFLSK